MRSVPRRVLVPLASAVLHGAVGVVLAFLAPPEVASVSTRISVDIRRSEPARPAPAPPPPAAEAIRRPPEPPAAPRPSRTPPVPNRREEPQPPANSQNTSNPITPINPGQPEKPEKPEKPAGTVNLFPTRALDSVATTSAPTAPPASRWGGTTRRAGDGLPAPGTRDAGADREEASARVRKIVADITGNERATSGNLPPVWRDMERKIDAAFSPPMAVVSDDNAGKGFLKQWLARGAPQSGTTPRGVDPSADANNQRYDQMMVGQQAGPPVWLRTEIEVVTDESGGIVSARVAIPSGRAKLDRMALDAVRAAVERGPVRDERGRMVSRWAVSASVAVAGPTALGFSFDESTGKAKGVHPMKKEVRTRVALLSVTPVR